MSAPHEVFLGAEWFGEEPDYRHPVEGFYGPEKPTEDESCIRYLRADLTCGECRRGNNQTEPFCERWSYESDSACMAFVPKEER